MQIAKTLGAVHTGRLLNKKIIVKNQMYINKGRLSLVTC